jgi:hypothetical protein
MSGKKLRVREKDKVIHPRELLPPTRSHILTFLPPYQKKIPSNYISISGLTHPFELMRLYDPIASQ